jgi:tetratricopeptide (TPR) repeat protein
VSARARTGVVVAALAALAAVIVAGAAVLSAEELPPPDDAVQAAQPREGRPLLALDLPLREDEEARDLARAAEAYDAGRIEEAAAIFRRYDSLEAKLGAAFCAWPGSLDRVEQLGALYPRSSLVQLHVGLARFWAGRGGAVTAWREARDAEPDTPYAVRAGDLLAGNEYAPGLPILVTDAEPPPGLAELAPAARLERLRELADGGPLDARLLYGVALQNLGRPVSARRVYTAAAAAFPDEPEALVADAVGRYTKQRPAAAFSRLGPLSRRFPESATVRFHLGLLLLWQRDVEEAMRQLRLAREAEPDSFIARRARAYLDELQKARTG